MKFKALYDTLLCYELGDLTVGYDNNVLDNITVYQDKMTSFSNGGILTITFKKMPQHSVYWINYTNKELPPTQTGTNNLQTVYLKSKTYSFQLYNEEPQDLTQAFASAGDIIDRIINGPLNSPIGGSIALLSLFSPLQLLAVTAQSLRLFSRTYLLNINFGYKLRRFLEILCRKSNVFPGVDSFDFDRLHTATYGRITEKEFSVDFFHGFYQLLALYLFFWFVEAAKQICIWKRPRIPRTVVFVFYYSSKLHFLFFIMYSTDILLYSLHSLLHLKKPHLYNSAAGVGLLLVVADFYRLVSRCFNTRVWMEMYKYRKEISQSIDVEKTNKILPSPKPSKVHPPNPPLQSCLLPTKGLMHVKAKEQPSSQWNQPCPLHLDYPKIYLHLQLNHGILIHSYETDRKSVV